MCVGNDCHLLTSTDGLNIMSSEVAALHCCQEEADTRLFFHAHHAATTGSRVVIVRSPDTDVAVIGCALGSKITAQLLLHTGTQHRRRYINLTAIASKLGPDLSMALPGLHAFTGYDSIRAFSSKGKKGPFNLVKGGSYAAMQVIGQHLPA